LRDPDNVQPRRINVDVRVDQAGHQETAAAVDDLRIILYRTVGNFANEAAVHHHVHAFTQRFRLAVEHAGGLKNNGLRHFAHTNHRLGRRTVSSKENLENPVAGPFQNRPLQPVIPKRSEGPAFDTRVNAASKTDSSPRSE